MTEKVFYPSRDSGLKTLENFVSKAGYVYSSGRNFVNTAHAPVAVSKLSPYIRYRLITEQEIIGSVLNYHDMKSAEKFIQELLWRSYWKGWLEMRPAIWTRFLEEKDHQRKRFADPNAVTDAESGKTGIQGFDQWSQELTSTGYLHNHIRMWFASIWIFTLRLPWTLGADFFLRNLLDADPASNTLSWRWVVGLKTPGKTYLATKENICRYTHGRFAPEGLTREAIELPEAPLETIDNIPQSANPDSNTPALLLITHDDMHPESLFLDHSIFKSAVIIIDPDLLFGEKSIQFARSAAINSVARLTSQIDGPVSLHERLDTELLLSAAQSARVKVIITPYAPVRPVAKRLALLTLQLREKGIELIQTRREWDSLFWPHATKGFFAFNKHIPSVLDKIGMR